MDKDNDSLVIFIFVLNLIFAIFVFIYDNAHLIF